MEILTYKRNFLFAFFAFLCDHRKSIFHCCGYQKSITRRFNFVEVNELRIGGYNLFDIFLYFVIYRQDFPR